METGMSDTAKKNSLGLTVFAKNNADPEVVCYIEERLEGKILYEETPEGIHSGLALQVDEEGLALVDGDQMLRADFTSMLRRSGHGNLHSELLVKAAKIKGFEGTPMAVDATAGLGEDAFLLAAAGFQVRLYENDPVIAALLWDALRRAKKDPALAEIAGRMQLCEEDSIPALGQLKIRPDVILLDPMFPARQKSALIKKKFQLLQQLERPCSHEKELLDAALACRPRKLVVKRPLKGPYLAEQKPDYSLKGKAIRYDCFVFSK